jgi:Holliday junction DNA helicase RuvB
MEERIITPASMNEEKEDITIRPNRLDDFIGQHALKESLKIFIEASKRRCEPPFFRASRSWKNNPCPYYCS